jgi:lipoprotein signal peptidase
LLGISARPVSAPGNGSASFGSRRQPRILAAVLLIVTGLDQVSKWWAYRHTAWPLVNIGGNLVIGTTLSRWLSYSGPGAVLDLFGALLLALGTYLLLRRPRRRSTTVAGGLFLTGWFSNLLDRLGLHEVTAPGSARGVVDFIFIGTQTFNFADISIALGTAGLLAAAALKFARARAGAEPVEHRVLVGAAAGPADPDVST